jgi:hypothetical protein
MFTVAAALDSLGLAERLRGNLSRAVAVLEEDMRLVDEIGYGITAPEVRYQLADTLWRVGQIERSRALCADGLRLAYAAGDANRLAHGLRVAASIALVQGGYELATVLIGAAEALLEATGIRFTPLQRSELQSGLAAAEAGLGAEAFNAARARGATLDPEAAIRLATDQERDARGDTRRATTGVPCCERP